MTKPLFKTTIIIWSEYDTSSVELTDLAREADQGDAYCSRSSSELIQDPASDPDFDDTDFFNDLDEEEFDVQQS